MSTENKAVHADKAPAAVGPYSHACWAGNTLYISGQIPLKGNSGELENGSAEAATRTVMDNIGMILEAAGLNFSHIVKCTVLLADINDGPAVNSTYESYFSGSLPAREAFQAAALPKGARVEISAIAHKQ